MITEDVATLITGATQSDDMGWHQGRVITWDPDASTNTVEVAGAIVNDLPVLSAGAVMIGVGDHVALLRIRHQYFILGRISPIQNSLRMHGAAMLEGASSWTMTSTSYVDRPGEPGPILSDVYIGPSRSCLIIIRCGISVAGTAGDSIGVASVEVSGASTITPTKLGPSAAFLSVLNGTANAASSCSSHMCFGPLTASTRA